MNNPEDYIKSLLIQEECEDAMDNILDKYFEAEDVKSTKTTTGNGTYYIMDPFPFILFDSEGNLSHYMRDYCRDALADYNSNKDGYRSLCFLPPFIKDTPVLTIFSQITRNYIRGILAHSDKGNSDYKEVIDFYNLLNDPMVNKSDDDYIYTKFNSWNALKSEVTANPSHRVFVPGDLDGGGAYMSLRSDHGNIIYDRRVRMNYNTTIIPAMDKITKMARDFKEKKNNIDETKKTNSSLFYDYISYMIANCAFDLKATEDSVTYVSTKHAGKIKSDKISSRPESFDIGTYKNTRLVPQDTNIDYWKDTWVGKGIDDINKTANGASDAWKKVVDDAKHTFNRKELDNDLEKFYNLKHFIPDVLGMESDSSRYDARTYEDPQRRKVKGVSGYDIYKNDKKIQDLYDEIRDLTNAIAAESDENKIKKLKKKIDADNEEIDIIKQKLDSRDAKGERNEKKAKQKLDALNTKGSVDINDIDKAFTYVATEKSLVEQLKNSLISN